MKRVLLIVILAVIWVPVFALEVTVAPLYFVDETAERAEPRNTFQSRLLDELEAGKTGGELHFRATATNRYNPPQSVGDAITVCRGEQATYLIYGFITRKEQTIQGELRLLDYEKREVVASFFAMDSNDHEDEFLKDLRIKIFRFMQEAYNIITVPEPASFAHFQIPFSAGYWQPVDENWIDLMFGFFRVDLGLQIIPGDRIFAASGYDHYVSLGLDFSYRMGRGRSYNAWDHGFTVTLPVQLHRRLSEWNEIYIGIGIMYSFDLLQIERLYESPAMEWYSAAGLMASFGWAFRANEHLLIFADVRAELRLYDSPMFSIGPRVGIIIRPYTKELVQRW